MMKLQEAFDQCLQTEWRGTSGEVMATINGQAALDFFGGASSLKSIKTPLIDRFVLWLANRGNGPATINRKLAALSKMLRFGHRRGELATMPFIPYQREPQGRTRWLTEEEESRMRDAFVAREMWGHWHAMEVLIDTGLRPSELWTLRNEDVQEGAIMVRKSKNGVVRCVPMTQRVAYHMEHRIDPKDKIGHPFPYDNGWMNYGWNIAKTMIGLANDKEFVVYALRHTCASRLLQRNVALHVVQGWLGHTNPAQTMRYAHLSQASYQQAMKVLERP